MDIIGIASHFWWGLHTSTELNMDDASPRKEYLKQKQFWKEP